MLVTRTPLRVSFFGGGSDLPAYYQQEGRTGFTLSCTIDKYVYIALKQVPGTHTKLMYSEVELVDEVHKLKHDRARETILYAKGIDKQFGDGYRFETGLEIASFADIPTAGTGLGSSSTFTVGLLKALLPELNNRYVAEGACYVEINLCNQPIGKQDQFAAAIGGLNLFQYSSMPMDVSIHGLHGDIYRNLELLNSHLMMFYTGQQRDASKILAQQSARVSDYDARALTDELVSYVSPGLAALENMNFSEFGRLLHLSWLAKQRITNGISNSFINEAYEQARKLGAIGGKVLGAGGGGYLLFLVPPEKQSIFRSSFGSKLTELPFKFTKTGTEVILNETPLHSI